MKIGFFLKTVLLIFFLFTLSPQKVLAIDAPSPIPIYPNASTRTSSLVSVCTGSDEPKWYRVDDLPLSGSDSNCESNFNQLIYEFLWNAVLATADDLDVVESWYKKELAKNGWIITKDEKFADECRWDWWEEGAGHNSGDSTGVFNKELKLFFKKLDNNGKQIATGGFDIWDREKVCWDFMGPNREGIKPEIGIFVNVVTDDPWFKIDLQPDYLKPKDDGQPEPEIITPSGEGFVCDDFSEACQLKNEIYRRYSIAVMSDNTLEIQVILNALDFLPKEFLEKVHIVNFQTRADMRPLGIYALYNAMDGSIQINPRWCDVNSDSCQEILTHEIGHSFVFGDWAGGKALVGQTVGYLEAIINKHNSPEFQKWLDVSGWHFKEYWSNDDPFVIPTLINPENPDDTYMYGTVNPEEDFCESFRYYVYHNQELKDLSPERHNFIKNEVFNGWEPERKDNGTTSQ